MLSNGTTQYIARDMDDKNKHILSLIEKFEQGKASPEDMRVLDVWFGSYDSNPDITNSLAPEQQQLAKSNLLQRIDNRIDEEIPEEPYQVQPKKISSIWIKTMAAASVLLLLSLGIHFFLNQNQTPKPDVADVIKGFVQGSNKAVLTLGDGAHIILDNTKKGQLANQGNVTINKTDTGAIIYGQNGKNQLALVNTLTTPRGGTFQLTLADGTKVWLNAASSITYPASFTGNSREVSITGEVYLEVSHNPDKPFRVKTDAQTIEVLGTCFNVNAYGGKTGTKTTLLKGAVALTSAGHRKLLKPGEQAMLNGNIIQVGKVDTGEVTAWKNGFFDFTAADIHTLMQEFSRWYDFDITFEGPQTKETFTGRIPRSWSFDMVIKIMETFKSTSITTKGRRIIVKQQF